MNKNKKVIKHETQKDEECNDVKKIVKHEKKYVRESNYNGNLKGR